MELNISRPDTEIGVTVTRSITQNNRKTEKLEHICEECNKKLINSLNTLGLGVS
jgi:hypothetical protein